MSLTRAVLRAPGLPGARRAVTSALLSGAALLLAGCATTSPYDEQTSVAKVSADIGIPATSIVHHNRCRAGQAFPGAPNVRMRECLDIETLHETLLVRYDKERGRYQTLALIDSHATGVVLKSHSTLVGELKQIQVKNERGYLIFDFVQPDMSGSGSAVALLAAYDRLRALGIPEVSGRDFVPAATGPGTITIPVYIPAHR